MELKPHSKIDNNETRYKTMNANTICSLIVYIRARAIIFGVCGFCGFQNQYLRTQIGYDNWQCLITNSSHPHHGKEMIYQTANKTNSINHAPIDVVRNIQRLKSFELSNFSFLKWPNLCEWLKTALKSVPIMTICSEKGLFWCRCLY